MSEPRHRRIRRAGAREKEAARGKPRERRKLQLWQAVVTPLVSIGVFFGLLEIVLALVGVQSVLEREDPFVGFVANVPLFVEETDQEGRRILVTANNKHRFFNPQRFPRDKSPGTYRIFCVGGSTTYGRPYDDMTSFAGWLRELLPVADARHRWEVINAGGISYASYRVARLMEELASYEPDLFVVYSGHNEFLEERTYGNLREVPGVVRSTAALLARTRTWAAMSSLLDGLGASPRLEQNRRAQLPGEVNTLLERSAGPERYEREDALRERILLHYRISLSRMVEIARSAGAEIIFVTPASNLKDCTPFKSQHTDGLESLDRTRSKELLAIALERAHETRMSEALEALDEAVAIDPRFAELHYRRGEVLLALGNNEAAEVALRRARDEDVCPLRALSPMRTVVSEVARQTRSGLVDFLDVLERAMLDDRGHPIPGKEYFLDHVHPTIEANRMLAVALIEAMIDRGILRPDESWGEDAIAEIATRIEGNLDRGMHARALASLAQVLYWAGKFEDARRPAAQALESDVGDVGVVATASTILASLSARDGDTAQARVFFRRALNANPRNPETHFQVGLMFLNEPNRDLEVAAAHILLASVMWPENDMTHQTFGLAMAERGRLEVAFPSLRQAVRLNPRNTDAERALARMRELLGTRANDLVAPRISVTSYPSGAPHEIVQMRLNETGREIPDGIWTEWYEGGEPKRFVDYAGGVPHGVEITWNPDGKVVSRTEYRQGKPADASATAMPG